MIPDMVWEDPPAPTVKQVAHERNLAVLEQLKANPGKWARVQDRVASGSGQTWKRWGCEVRMETIKGARGATRVWARWVEP